VSGGTATELTLIRHAPALTGGRLCGRTDVEADVTDAESLSMARSLAGTPNRLITSPARRCRQTALALWPDRQGLTDAALWEQDFGAWEGRFYTDLPDLGVLPPDQLADHRPPDGESFADMATRVGIALRAALADGDATIVAHAGTVRAALSMALGHRVAGLAFEVAPLSVTKIALLSGGGGWIIRSVNGSTP
jgi:alpha-ribazole phosphatase